MDNISHVVTDQMNLSLTKSVTTVEIKGALFSFGPTRAPGPDGFTAAFYQEYWNIIGPDLVDEVRRFFYTGKITEELNQTNLCLIPKITHPKTIKDFRPISLCNVAYKIISKNLVVRLKSVLSSVVSENQAAFHPR